MSFLSTSGNAGYSGLPQNVADSSCGTQYKIAVDGVSSVCNNDAHTYIQDGLDEEQTYVSHFNDGFFQTKFKIDPNEIYTFQDSDVIASEITVSHTEDNYSDCGDSKNNISVDNVRQDFDVIEKLANGIIKEEVRDEVVTNGHISSVSNSLRVHFKDVQINTKAQHKKSLILNKDLRTNLVSEIAHKYSKPSPKRQNSGNNNSTLFPNNTKTSISNVIVNNDLSTSAKILSTETFLDVFKREQMGRNADNVKGSLIPPIKVPHVTPRKVPSGKPTLTSKPRKGRGPTVHEALQRIPLQRSAHVLPNASWHAPGSRLFDCGPLTEHNPRLFPHLDSSSSEEDDHKPNFGSLMGSVEEGSAESRGARLAARRAALRRQVGQASIALKLSHSHAADHALAATIKKQLSRKSPSIQLSPHIVNELLATRGMSSLLSNRERRRLREKGWSGGDSGDQVISDAPTVCAEDGCNVTPLPCGRYCLAHITLAHEQRLYAACAAVFAGGSRCKQPLLPLHDQTPLCTEHAWKRDNYDKISRECKPKKVVRKRVCPPNPRRTKRRKRPPAKPRNVPSGAAQSHSHPEFTVYSNSSAYDSSEEAGIGAITENEFIGRAANSTSLEVGVVGHVPPDDILDPAVLSQIPDEAFTEFFNQAEGAPPFAESEELARALEAVLDERALDSIADCVFTHAPAHQHHPRPKVQVQASVSVEMSSTAPS